MSFILSANQKRLLEALGREKTIAGTFYLSGGTALAEYYLRHRYSEDLDFFSEREFDPQVVSVVLKKLQAVLDITATSFEQSFNRNLFLLTLNGDSIKTEFTYFPFPRIELRQENSGVVVDSLIDIAVNKLFTIYQKPRSRDFIDLYCILKKEKAWTIEGLKEKAQIKFDHFLDPVQLAAQFIKATELKDYPRMITKLSEKDWQDFFMQASKKISKQNLT